MNAPVLTREEFAALVAIDGSFAQRRPSAELEIELRRRGLIEREGLSQLPTRTARGEAMVKAGRQASMEKPAARPVEIVRLRS